MSVVFFFSFSMSAKTKLLLGEYRGVLILNAEKNIELPFNFSIVKKGKKNVLTIRNGDERIAIDGLKLKGDSLRFELPVFDTEFKIKVLPNGNMEGIWQNNYRKEKNKIPFKAFYNSVQRFPFVPSKGITLFEGEWETIFSPDSKDSSKAIGVFKHQEQTDYVNGTFLTETGDYRFLEGIRNGQNLYLSCFDGSHAFLFTATLKEDGSISGDFYSGTHWHETWVAKKNSNFKLRDGDSITTVVNVSTPLSFSYPDLMGKTVSLSDKAFENKAVIVQLMGSWCPNCMDESAYLSQLHKQYQPQGLEIIALAYEKTNDIEKAKQQVIRLKNRFAMNYAILLTGLTGKDKASESMPLLNKVTAFPTTLFLNRQHQIVKIHTGFNGPATGKAYELFKTETERLINRLLH
jgi:thiol-disulfide isomerase/thioredoxin